MDIVTELLVLSLVMIGLCGVIVAQSFAVARLIKSWSWVLIASAFAVLEARQIWRFVRLPATILRAQTFVNKAGENAMPARLSIEEWVNIGAGLLFLVLIIAYFDRMRRDLRKLGI